MMTTAPPKSWMDQSRRSRPVEVSADISPAFVARPLWKVGLTIEPTRPSSMPVDDGARLSAVAEGVRLTSIGGRLVAQFVVTADDVAQASRSAMAHWAHVVEIAKLPAGTAIDLVVERMDPSSH